MADDKMVCDQCGDEISQDDERIIFMLNNGFKLCSQCAQELVINYRDAIERRKQEKKIKHNGKLRPQDIKDFLDQYVIGQEKAKIILSNAVYNHYKKIKYNTQHKDDPNAVELAKSNIIMLGRSGTGKTHLLRTIAKFLQVPFVVEDSSSFSSTGFVGKDVEQIIGDLVQTAEGSDITEKISKAEMGIIYMDEFDKISRKGENPSISRDVGGESVQQALLTLIEGGIVDVPVTRGQRLTPMTQTVKVNTENILFVCGGSFEGIENIIASRLRKGQSGIGFGASPTSFEQDKNKKDIFLEVQTEDFKKFGMIPEILGRLPIICPLEEMTEDSLIAILTKPKNALVKQYNELFKMEESELIVTKEALTKIAQEAIKRKTGARALRSIMEEILGTTMFDLPNHPEDTTIIIDVEKDNFIIRRNSLNNIKRSSPFTKKVANL